MQTMDKYKGSPLQHLNKPSSKGGNAGMGMLGGIIGSALLAPLGPLGMAVGASVGSSLGGKGDLSGVTPQGVALDVATAGVPVPGAASVATEGAKATATQAAMSGATDAAAAGTTSALSQQATTGLANMAAPPIGEAAEPNSLRSALSPFPLSNMAKESSGGFIENPSNVAELGINKLAGGFGQIKESLFRAGGGYIDDGSMYSNKGGYAGKGCNCGPMVNCNCE